MTDKKKIKLHLILDASDELVVEVIKSFENMEIIQWDYSFDTAYQWTVYNEEKEIDVFLASEFAQVSTTSGDGKQIPRDTALLRRVRDLHLLRPQTKFILLCDEERELPENKQFLSYLVSIGIYDFRTQTELTEDMLREMIEEPRRDITHVQEYLPENIGAGSLLQGKTFRKNRKKTQKEEKDRIKHETQGLVRKFKKIINSVEELVKKRVSKENKVDPDCGTSAFPEAEPAVDAFPVEDKVLFVEGEKIHKEELDTVYAYGKGIENKIENNTGLEIMFFSSWEKFLIAVKTVVPDAVVLDGKEGNVEEKIKHLRRNKKLVDVPIAVVGGTTSTSADEWFEKLDKNAIERLKTVRERLKAVWDSASDEACRDHLTGLYNRRFFDKLLKGFTGRFSVLICDLDYFKKINDTYGHSTGDEVLKKFAQYLNKNTREIDIVIRYGGEEFLVIFPQTGKKDAKMVAEQLRKGWQGEKIYNSTFSGGIAEHPSDGSPEEVIKAADRALYRAKKIGRNRVCMAGEVQKTVLRLFRLNPIKEFETGVFLVVGAAPGVGATSFTLALAKFLHERGSEVEILDAGGGVSRWLDSRAEIPVRKVPPYSVCPGCFTIVDAGQEIPGEIQPLARDIFVVTDLSRRAVELKRFRNTGAYLIGNRDAPFDALKEIASLWGLTPLFSLPEDRLIREAEMKGKICLPKSWIKHFKKIV